MAPTARKRTRTRTTKTRRKPTRTNYKKQQVKPQNIDPPENIKEDYLKIDGLDNNLGFDASSSACSTPKAERFRIPEIVDCPPAPKKPRMVPNCSIQRTPIDFFAPPDLDLFFFFALGGISA